ncbi:unnamed protein product [Bathycoccus prasinos]
MFNSFAALTQQQIQQQHSQHFSCSSVKSIRTKTAKSTTTAAASRGVATSTKTLVSRKVITSTSSSMAPSSRLTRTRSAQLASDVLAAGELDTIRALSPTRRGGGGGGKITTTRRTTTRTKSSAAGKEDEAARYGLTNSASGLTIPTMLTLARVAAIPAFAYMYYQTTAWSAPGCCFVFVLAAITDWLDGYLARKWNQSSAFGAFLDPVADKLMVACALVLLCSLAPKGVSHPYLVAVPSAIIIGREITMSALREWASAKGGDAHKAVKVNNLGKWKTATQMVAISVLLLVRDGAPKAIESFLPKMLASELTNVGVVTLWVSAALAALSLYVYMAPVLKYMLE